MFQKLKKANPNMKFLIVGGGMWEYDIDIKLSKPYIEEINPHIFISRDSYSLGIADKISNKYDGIDCGFFVNDCHKPMKINHDYVAFADYFGICNDTCDIVYSYHNTEHPYEHAINNFVSDIPEGYLNLYANAKKVYSNRVHACVASLAYNVPTQLVNRNELGKRTSLFDKVGVTDISKMSTIDSDYLKEVKQKQIEWIRKVI